MYPDEPAVPELPAVPDVPLVPAVPDVPTGSCATINKTFSSFENEYVD